MSNKTKKQAVRYLMPKGITPDCGIVDLHSQAEPLSDDEILDKLNVGNRVSYKYGFVDIENSLESAFAIAGAKWYRDRIYNTNEKK